MNIRSDSYITSTRGWLALAIGVLLAYSCFSTAAYMERIVAVVNDSVILQSELKDRVTSIKRNLEAQNANASLPPDSIIRRQVLERMIIDRLQQNRALSAGIQVDDATIQRSVETLAQRNNLSVPQFREALKSEGIEFDAFVEEMRNEIAVNQLRAREVSSQIKVSEREIETYLENQSKHEEVRNNRYRLGHILIGTSEGASPTDVYNARERAERVIDELREGGLEFDQAAMSVSAGAQALQGGDLGWRPLSEIPTLFVDTVVSMQEGDVRGPIRSPSGFHIIKLLEYKGTGKHMVEQTHARHILITTDEVTDDDTATGKLIALRNRIIDGDDFGRLARSHSEDKGTAIKGGDLGWVSDGVLVPQFQEAMDKLEVGELSEPVQSQFGWHLIQVLGREERDNTVEYQRAQAREQIRARKIEEQTELWLRRLRDEAYVEIRLQQQ